LKGELEAWRFHQEILYLVERADISEELTRLESHRRQFEQFMAEEGEAGRKLDFLSQELFREVNTIGSKASDAEVAGWVVELKFELEKIREQIQNVE
ncbi:MAG: endoribonuclease YicC domain-containing protein, partial [Vicinamibacteria bacterium]